MFKGSIVALITPFKNNVMDQDRYASIIQHHIANGTKGVVPAGTTGESPTLDHEEHKKVIEIAVKECKGKIPVIAGTIIFSLTFFTNFRLFGFDLGKIFVVVSDIAGWQHKHSDKKTRLINFLSIKFQLKRLSTI